MTDSRHTPRDDDVRGMAPERAISNHPSLPECGEPHQSAPKPKPNESERCSRCRLTPNEYLDKILPGFTWGKPVRVPGPTAVAKCDGDDAHEKKDDWELVWQHKDQRFYFSNRFTKARKPAIPSLWKQSRDASDTNIHASPNKAQIQAAFEAVLENKYMHLVPALLKQYDINLNIELGFAGTTPLDYVTRLEDIETVRLFLENGADANLEHGYTLGGRPLLTAVRKGNQRLVEILVQRTDRIPCTRAFGHAVSYENTLIANILLANGVKCDFDDSDRPPVSRSPPVCGTSVNSYYTTCGDPSEPEEYTPPLVRAIYVGDIELVRLLLAHGADVNIGYHDLSPLLPSSLNPCCSMETSSTCGRPVHLAMYMERQDIVQLLLSYGADINLAQPVWQHHECKMIPRDVHDQFMARLRSIAASADMDIK